MLGLKYVKLNKINKIEDRYYENILAVADNKLDKYNDI